MCTHRILRWLPRSALFILILAGITAALPVTDLRSEDQDTVALVNGERVTRAELRRMMTSLDGQHADLKGLARIAMRNLIQHRLILQEGLRRNITVTEEDLDHALFALRRRFEDLRSFGTWMKERDLNDRSLLQSLRDGIMDGRVRTALTEEARVTETDVEQYYNAHKAGLRIEEVWIQIIVVKDRLAAEEIQEALQKGEDFARLAQQRSIGFRASRGGDIGWVDSETLWLPMRQAVSTLKPGEAIGPLVRGQQFLIVRLHDRRSGRAKTLKEARPTIEKIVLVKKRREIIDAWLATKEREASIKILTELNDPSNAAGLDGAND